MEYFPPMFIAPKQELRNFFGAAEQVLAEFRIIFSHFSPSSGEVP
jgi:hypothetical protein